MATAEVKEEENVYVFLPWDYDHAMHILSWVLSHFPKDKTKIVATSIIPTELTRWRVMSIEFVNRHLAQCARQKFKAEGLIHYKADLVEGILELIDLRAIKNLVMGFWFSSSSIISASLTEKANPTCKIWFINRKGNLQLTRYPKSVLREPTSKENKVQMELQQREKLHQKEIKEIQKRENDNNALLKRENEQLKLEKQLQNDYHIQLEDLDKQKQQVEKRISDLEIDYKKLKQERDNAIKEAKELRKQREHSFANSVGSLTFNEEHVPSHFICPIMQEIMKNPCIATDGFTYEAEGIKTWLNRGHNTSPMTNLVLPRHDLIPNHVLRSAIQEWLQQHPQSN